MQYLKFFSVIALVVALASASPVVNDQLEKGFRRTDESLVHNFKRAGKFNIQQLQPRGCS